MISPSSWPITTFSPPSMVGALESRSKARPFSGSTSLPTTGKPSTSSWRTRCRLACSASRYWTITVTSSTAGRVRVRSHTEHCSPSTRASQVQPERLRLAHTHHTSPLASTYLPLLVTGTIACSSREKPSAVPQDTQTEFSK